jgi:hypothetical protein
MQGLLAGNHRPPKLPAKRLKIIDYYTVPWEDVPSGTPPVVLIVVFDCATGKEEQVFAWHLALQRGFPDGR